jgi:hypothetical protein
MSHAGWDLVGPDRVAETGRGSTARPGAIEKGPLYHETKVTTYVQQTNTFHFRSRLKL